MSPAALNNNNPPSMALRSSSATHIRTVLSPLSLSLPLPSLPSEVAKVSERNGNFNTNNNNNNRWLFELDVDDNNDDDVSFYDLYQSPCRGILRASNDELLDQNDLNQMNDDSERNYIISYNSNSNSNSNNNGGNSDLYKAYYYYFDDLEYCGTTFFGGCRFVDLEELEDAIDIDETEITAAEAASPSSSAPQHSYANWTVVYDYEIHYIDNSGSGTVSNDSTEESSSKRGDPIPALEYLETIVAEHLGEVVGLSRRSCDPNDTSGGRSSISSRKHRARKYQHDFSDEELERILAISSEPKDVLDPDHANCMVPVSSTIGETSDCIPVTGGIRIYLNTTGIPGGDESSSSLADLELSIKSGFQRLIRFGMQHNLYVSGEDDDDEVLVKYISFIGTRIVFGDANEEEKIVDDEMVQVNEKDETTSTTTTGSTSDTKDEESTFPPLLNLLDGGIDESNPSKNGVAGLAVASIAIIALAALLAAMSTKTQELVSKDADDGAETPIDIEVEV